jgi:hypothetical protein
MECEDLNTTHCTAAPCARGLNLCATGGPPSSPRPSCPRASQAPALALTRGVGAAGRRSDVMVTSS